MEEPEPELEQYVSQLPFGGRIKYFLRNWELITSDPVILGIVRGYHLDLMTMPVQQTLPRCCIKQSESQEVSKLLGEFVNRGIIEYASSVPDEFISSIFTRPKPDGRLRVILNLKPFNLFINYVHFKMDSIYSALRLMSPRCYMASIDLTDAYFSVPVALAHRKFLRFEFQGKLLQFTCLPMGLKSSPLVFTKLLKPVYSSLRRKGFMSVAYIDDSYLQGATEAECHRNVVETRQLLESLGFVISEKKSVFNPAQKITFLGFVLDSRSMTVSLTKQRTDKILSACELALSSEEVLIHAVATLLGRMVSSFVAIPIGRLYSRSLEADKI